MEVRSADPQWPLRGGSVRLKTAQGQSAPEGPRACVCGCELGIAELPEQMELGMRRGREGERGEGERGQMRG